MKMKCNKFGNETVHHTRKVEIPIARATQKWLLQDQDRSTKLDTNIINSNPEPLIEF